MKKQNLKVEYAELSNLCNEVKEMVEKSEYEKCEKLISKAMKKYPHSPQPHNLFGVLLEFKGDYITAMKHFRAAWSLDPAYTPARYNLERYSDFIHSNKCAFSETDCETKNEKKLYKIEYDENGLGHLVKRN
ncbi:MAG: hypothetical protein RR069_04625 [Oscillospiraceae bacterium]